MSVTSEMRLREKIESGRGGCLVIGEVGQAHDGSLGMAHAYIDAVARAGVDAVKFQTHIAAAESTRDEPWRVKFSRQDATRYDYWKRMEFSETQWAGLAEHAGDCGIWFLSSPFSLEAVEMLDRIGVPAWKVGAGEITNLPMLRAMARTGKPVILSSGMATWAEMDTAVRTVREAGSPVAVLQCTTAYPCPPEKIGLNLLAELRERYGCVVGLSDHSGAIYAGLAAAALGAQIIEAHVVFSKECFGPDVQSSLTTAELAQLVTGVRVIELALANPVNKEEMATELGELRGIFGKSLVAKRDLLAGEVLTADDLVCRKPGSGIPVARFDEIVGRRLKQAVAGGAMLSEEDFE